MQPDMKRVDAWYLPDRDSHFKPWLLRHKQTRDGRLGYQLHKYDAALKCVWRRRVAVDVGAHVGFWSYWMERDFAIVHAFEPMPASCDCWLANVPQRDGVYLHRAALGASTGVVNLMEDVLNSGATRIEQDSICSTVTTMAPMVRLDDFDFQVLDFLKIDCEGYEAFVIEGALETLQRCRPTVVVEQKLKCGLRYGRKDDEAVTLLESLGATRVWVNGGDYLMVFD